MPVLEPDVGSLPHVGAPRLVVGEQVAAEAPEDGGVQEVRRLWRRRDAHLQVGQVEDEVLPLVPHVVALESEVAAQPVQEVHAVLPVPVRRPPEFPDGA